MKILAKWRSDDAYVMRQRRFLAWRRPLGLTLLMIGVVLGVSSYWVWRERNPSEVLHLQPPNETTFEIGFIWGLSVAQALVATIGCILLGISYLWGWRGTRLLIKYHDQLRNSDNDTH